MDTSWRSEYKNYTSDKFELALLENGAKSLSQSWVLGVMYNKWRKIKGLNKLDPKENKGQLQSSFAEFDAFVKKQSI